jgi:hypothetical protein
VAKDFVLTEIGTVTHTSSLFSCFAKVSSKSAAMDNTCVALCKINISPFHTIMIYADIAVQFTNCFLT